MTDIKDLSKKLREARAKATSGEWQTWAGWLAWSKENDSIFPDETHWILASKEVQKNPNWTGSPKKFDEIIGRIHRDQDQASIAFVMNNITRILDELDRLIEVEKVLRKALKDECFCPGEESRTTGEYILCEPCAAIARADEIGKGKDGN